MTKAADIGINFVTNAISVGLCSYTICHLWKVRNHHSVKPLQPKLLAASVVWLNLAATIYTWGNVLNLTWEAWFLAFAFCGAMMLAVLFVMILRYYQEFVQTENKIRIAAKLLDHNQKSLKIQTLEHSSWLDKSLEKTSTIALIGLFVFLESCLPLYLYTALDNTQRDTWQSPASNLDRRFMSRTFGISFWTNIFYDIALIWIVVQMRKKHKEITQKIRNVAFSVGISLLLQFIAFTLFYSSPLAKLSFDTFQFMPIFIYHIPLSYEAIAIYVKIKDMRQNSNDGRRSRRTPLDSPTGSESNQDAGIKNEFLAVINNSEGFKIMMEAAKKEYCVENVLFYAAVSDWEALPIGSEAKATRAREIVNVFCVESAAAAVNISYRTRLELETALSAKDIRDNFFESAKREVINLMLWQTYVNVRKLPTISEILSQA